MIIDTHSHLNFKAYKNDREEIIKRTLKENIWIINVGSKYETSEEAVKIAEKHKKGVYAAVGLHPIYIRGEFVKIKIDPEEGEFLVKEEFFNKEKYRKLALSASQKVVAIGEIGLDYYYKPKTNIKLKQFKEAQEKVFIEQLELAKELNLPVILHCRMAHDDLLNILKKFQVSGFRFQGVMHCFTGNWEQAQQYINLGFYIGVNGIIFKFNIDETIKKILLDKILVETDCPYLTPPQEGSKRNEPIFIKHIIQKIADLKGANFDDVVENTTQNARKLFNI